MIARFVCPSQDVERPAAGVNRFTVKVGYDTRSMNKIG